MSPVVTERTDRTVDSEETLFSSCKTASHPELRELSECLERKVLPTFDNCFRDAASLYEALVAGDADTTRCFDRCDVLLKTLSEPFFPEGLFGKIFLKAFPINGRFFLQDLVHRGTRGPRKLHDFIRGEFRSRDECLSGMNKEFYRDWFQEACRIGDDPLLQLEERLRGAGVKWRIMGRACAEQLASDRKALLSAVTRELVANAITASGGAHEGIQVDIVARDEKVRVAVRDRGCGIDESKIPKLFRRRRRANGCSGGSGLPWVKNTVESALGGRIRAVRSRHGGGTLIIFDIPLAGTTS